MNLTAEQAEDLLFELHDLLDAVRGELKLSVPTHSTTNDIELVRTRFGTTELYELEIWLMMCRGPVLISRPLIGFAGARVQGEHFHYLDVLESYPEWENLRWVPVAGDGCGNFYVFPLTDRFGEYRPVFLVRVEEDSTKLSDVVASNLLIFLKRLIKSELTGEQDTFSRKRIVQADAAVLDVPFNFDDVSVRHNSYH